PSVALTAPPDQATFSAAQNITLSANAADLDGSIAKVDFFASGFLIGTAVTPLYTIVWTNVLTRNYLILARATDNIGNATTSASRTMRVINGEASFTGVPQSVPGIIQAEDFDGGGEGVAFHDTDASNNGGQYRSTAVDIQTTSDYGGGYNVGWTAGGEWLKYSINAEVDGLYTLGARVASSGDGGTFPIEFDGINATGPMTNSNSGDWQAWQTLTKTNIFLSAGPHMMRLVLDSSGPNGTVGNFNYFTLSAILHRYSFKEAPGATVAVDSVGGADGNVIGMAAFTGDGRLNLFGGYVDLPNGLISGLYSATFEAWLTWNGGGNWQRIFDFGDNSNGENNQGTGLTYVMLTPQDLSGVLHFAISTNAEQTTVWNGPLPIGQQTHVAVTYDFISGSASLFVNGQLVANGSALIPLSAIRDINVWLGRSNWPDPPLNATFQEFRVYGGALPPELIAASYAAGPDALLGARPRLTVSS